MVARKGARGPENRSPVPGMSREEWQRMLMGMAHGAEMIALVRDQAQAQGKTEPMKRAAADADAIYKALALLQALETAAGLKGTVLQ